jgi:hypothetical protein
MIGGRSSRDRMVVGFTTIYEIGAYHYLCCGFINISNKPYQYRGSEALTTRRITVFPLRKVGLVWFYGF